MAQCIRNKPTDKGSKVLSIAITTAKVKDLLVKKFLSMYVFKNVCIYESMYVFNNGEKSFY